MKQRQSLYEILEVSSQASAEQIKKSFRRLALKYHPDQNNQDPGAEERFKEILRAYHILKNPELRSVYDRSGNQGLKEKGVEDVAANPDNLASLFKDLFSEIFEKPKKAKANKNLRGLDLKYRLQVSLWDLAQGKTQTIQFVQERPLGKKTVELKVPIPLGSRPGLKLKIREEGDQKAGQRPGDLWVHLELKPNDYLVLAENGFDVIARLPLSIVDAVRGTVKKVLHPWGFSMVNIPAGMRPGQRLKVPGKGLPLAKESLKNGDLYIEPFLSVPENANDKNIIQFLDGLTVWSENTPEISAYKKHLSSTENSY